MNILFIGPTSLQISWSHDIRCFSDMDFIYNLTVDTIKGVLPAVGPCTLYYTVVTESQEVILNKLCLMNLYRIKLTGLSTNNDIYNSTTMDIYHN